MKKTINRTILVLSSTAVTLSGQASIVTPITRIRANEEEKTSTFKGVPKNRMTVYNADYTKIKAYRQELLQNIRTERKKFYRPVNTYGTIAVMSSKIIDKIIQEKGII